MIIKTMVPNEVYWITQILCLVNYESSSFKYSRLFHLSIRLHRYHLVHPVVWLNMANVFYSLAIYTKQNHVFAPMGRFHLELIYLYYPPSSHLVYLCFCPVGLSLLQQHYQQVFVGVEVTSVSWLGQLTVGV